MKIASGTRTIFEDGVFSRSACPNPNEQVVRSQLLGQPQFTQKMQADEGLTREG